MSVLSEAADRAYDRACGIRHSMSHHPGIPQVSKDLIGSLAEDYSAAKKLLDAVARDDGDVDSATVEADFFCGAIREAAMAALICGARPIQKDRGRTVVSAGLNADEIRDCLVKSFGLDGSRADTFAGLLELVTRGGALESALRGVGDKPAKVIEIYDCLTRPRGDFDWRELFS